MERIKTGSKGEEAAVAFLVSLGYKIIHRNYRCRLGEIDIIARDGHATVFVEVRSTNYPHLELAAQSVRHRKKRKLVNLVNHYVQKHPVGDYRIDIICIGFLPDGIQVQHYQNAVTC